jgi:hypothetical protein
MVVVIQLTRWTIFLFSQCSITAENSLLLTMLFNILRTLSYDFNNFFALDSAHKAVGSLFATLLTIFFYLVL